MHHEYIISDALLYKQVNHQHLTSYYTMYYITVSIIVILCGGYVSRGYDHAFYTYSSVNAPIGKCLLLQ